MNSDQGRQDLPLDRDGEWMDVIYDMSKILNTGLDLNTLRLCSKLLQEGVHPEALAAIIKELGQEQKAKQMNETW
jgi:mitotic-spindle organizing protein 1